MQNSNSNLIDKTSVSSLLIISSVKQDTQEHRLNLQETNDRISHLENKMEKLIEKSETNLKEWLKENTVTKSELFESNKKTIEWVEKNTASKLDIAKSENKMLWGIVSIIIALVGATAYIVGQLAR